MADNICPNCGTNLENDAVFCEECGFRISDTPKKSSQIEQKSDIKAKKIRFVRKK